MSLSKTLPRGHQRPRVQLVPPFVDSLGAEAVALAEYAGLVLDDWQAWVLSNSLGRQASGLWAAGEIGLVLPRQNGKNGTLEARQLAGLFLLSERLQIHSAHQFDTSLEAYRRLKFLIQNTPELDEQVARYVNSHGEEGIELKNGCRIRFRTRTKGGGRGFSCNTLYLDEAMELPEATHSALMPTMSAMPNPQVWYTGSAVDQSIHDNGVVLARVRKRGMEGSPGLMYAEWSADEDAVRADPELADDVELWAQANPALGIRIRHEHVQLERESMAQRSFEVERLGVGDWPDPSGARQVIPPERVKACEDTSSREAPGAALSLSFDVTPDRQWSSISVAGLRADDRYHVEVVDRRPGTEWVVARIVELRGSHNIEGPVRLDDKGPAGSLAPELVKAGVEIRSVTAAEHAAACGALFDAFQDGTIRHLGQAELVSSLRGAAKRPLGEAWAWSRKSSGVDISPLVSVTLALQAAAEPSKASPEPWFDFA